MTKVLLVKVSIALLALFHFSPASAVSVKLSNGTSASLREGPITTKISLDRKGNRSCLSAESWWWGAEQSCPSVRIAALEVKFRGKAVFIPFSAFSDLGNPHKVSIARTNSAEEYIVRIDGGDAADSYTAVLRFKSSLLLERKVASGEFPDDAWEQTIYKFNFEPR